MRTTVVNYAFDTVRIVIDLVIVPVAVVGWEFYRGLLKRVDDLQQRMDAMNDRHIAVADNLRAELTADIGHKFVAIRNDLAESFLERQRLTGHPLRPNGNGNHNNDPP